VAEAVAVGGAWRVLVQRRDIRRLFVGNSVSLLGSSITLVALPLTAVLGLHASPAQMGLLGAAALLPHLVLGLPAGVWVDRLPYRRLLVWCDLAQMVAIGSVPAAAAFGALTMTQLYAVVLAAGLANLFETVTATSFTPQLVPRDDLFAANSVLMVSTATVNTVGVAIGGLLVAVVSAPMALAVDAVSFAVSAAVKAHISHAGHPVRRGVHLGADMVDGLRAVFTHRLVRPMVLAATVGAFAGQAQAVVLVLFLVRERGLTPGWVGAAIALSGVAGIVAAVLGPRLTRRVGIGPAFITGGLLASSAGLVLAVAGRVSVAAAQIMRGAGPSLFGVNQQTLRQSLIPPTMLARVNAVWRFLVFGGQSLGALVGGLLGATVGLRATLILTSAVMLSGIAIAISSPLRTLRTVH
jgi:MFS family permease